MFVIVTCCLVVAGTETATAQALCPWSDGRAFNADARTFEVEVPRAKDTRTVEADLAALRGTLPGGTWRMPSSGGIASDGLALEGVSLTRNTEAGSGSNVHTFDIVVDLRASARILVDLELVVVDGERRLPLGAFTDIAVRCEAKSVSRKFSIADSDFASFFAAGRAPTLRVKRTTLLDGC
jgi:hypothetical protein